MGPLTIINNFKKNKEKQKQKKYQTGYMVIINNLKMTIVSEIKSQKNSMSFQEIKIHGSDGKE